MYKSEEQVILTIPQVVRLDKWGYDGSLPLDDSGQIPAYRRKMPAGQAEERDH